MACTTGMTELLKTVMPKKITFRGPAIFPRRMRFATPRRAFLRSGVGTLRHVRPLVMRAAGGGLRCFRLPRHQPSGVPSTERPCVLSSSQLRVLISARCPHRYRFSGGHVSGHAYQIATSGANTMNCLVCGDNAELIDVTIDAVSFACPRCGEYAVSSSAIATGQVEELEPEQRRDALDQAKRSAQPGARPVITTYLLA